MPSAPSTTPGFGSTRYWPATPRATPGADRSLLTDALGSVIALADEEGAVTARNHYSPFGESRKDENYTGNPLTYTGREDDDTGLYYYRARYYDPGLKRFISSDPIGLGDGPNTYSYVYNNPVNATDPLGLCGPLSPVCWTIGREAVKQTARRLAQREAARQAARELGQQSVTILPGGDTAARPEEAGQEAADEISDEAGFAQFPPRGPTTTVIVTRLLSNAGISALTKEFKVQVVLERGVSG